MSNTLQNSNFVLVEMERRFTDYVNGLYVDPTWDPAIHATVSGRVVSVPNKIESDNYRSITDHVKEGDRVYFSYAVIFDYIKQDTDDSPEYKNLLLHDGKEYWRVSPSEIFATKNEFGLWNMVTEMVMVEPLVTDYRGFLISRREDITGVIKALPAKKYDFNISDTVVFEEKYVQTYTFDGKEYWLVPPRRVVGVVSDE